MEEEIQRVTEAQRNLLSYIRSSMVGGRDLDRQVILRCLDHGAVMNASHPWSVFDPLVGKTGTYRCESQLKEAIKTLLELGGNPFLPFDYVSYNSRLFEKEASGFVFSIISALIEHEKEVQGKKMAAPRAGNGGNFLHAIARTSLYHFRSSVLRSADSLEWPAVRQSLLTERCADGKVPGQVLWLTARERLALGTLDQEDCYQLWGVFPETVAAEERASALGRPVDSVMDGVLLFLEEGGPGPEDNEHCELLERLRAERREADLQRSLPLHKSDGLRSLRF